MCKNTWKDTGNITLPMDADSDAYILLRSDGAGKFVKCGAGLVPVALTLASVTSGNDVAAKLFRNSEGTFLVTAANAFANGVELYAAADGEVSDTVAGDPIGIANAAANAQGDLVELIRT